MLALSESQKIVPQGGDWVRATGAGSGQTWTGKLREYDPFQKESAIFRGPYQGPMYVLTETIEVLDRPSAFDPDVWGSLPQDDPAQGRGPDMIGEEDERGWGAQGPEMIEDFGEISIDPKGTPRQDVLDEASKLVHGDRNASYGEPTQNFTDTAALWNLQFSHKLKEPFTSTDVALALVQLKLARIKASPKRDNWADIIGYAACGFECDVSDGRIDQ